MAVSSWTRLTVSNNRTDRRGYAGFEGHSLCTLAQRLEASKPYRVVGGEPITRVYDSSHLTACSSGTSHGEGTQRIHRTQPILPLPRSLNVSQIEALPHSCRIAVSAPRGQRRLDGLFYINRQMGFRILPEAEQSALSMVRSSTFNMDVIPETSDLEIPNGRCI